MCSCVVGAGSRRRISRYGEDLSTIFKISFNLTVCESLTGGTEAMHENMEPVMQQIELIYKVLELEDKNLYEFIVQ